MPEAPQPNGHDGSPPAGSAWLSFAIGGVVCALPLGRVRQIQGVATLTPIPTMPPFLAGLVAFHGLPVPVVDLGRKFGLRESPIESEAAILVVDSCVASETTMMGILVDRLADVLQTEIAEIRPVPPLGSRLRAEFIRGVLPNGDNFVLVLDLDLMLTCSEAEALDEWEVLSAGPQPSPLLLDSPLESRDVSPSTNASSAFLLFTLGGRRWTVPLTQITEVLEWLPVSAVPGTPPFVRGAANIRGIVVPVVDLGLRFDLPGVAVTDRACLLVTEGEVLGERVPLAVAADSVEQVIEAGSTNLAEVPSFGTPVPPQFLSGMVETSGAFIPVLDLGMALGGDVLCPRRRKE